MKSKITIGLCGGIGSGKSTVAALLAELQAAVISADELNHQELDAPEVCEELSSWWGESVRDSSGRLDRKRIAEIVFGDPTQRRRLEKYIHPRVARERDRLVDKYQADPDVRAIVLDTPLLLESHIQGLCDAVVFIDATPEVRFARVAETRGWTKEQWIQREKSQMALDKKAEIADHTLANNSSHLDQLRPAVHNLLNEVLAVR